MSCTVPILDCLCLSDPLAGIYSALMGNWSHRRAGTVRPKSELPPVTSVTAVPELKVDGQRLVTLGTRWLRLTCECGHEGDIPVGQLVERYGLHARVREAITAVRCHRCGRGAPDVTLMD